MYLSARLCLIKGFLISIMVLFSFYNTFSQSKKVNRANITSLCSTLDATQIKMDLKWRYFFRSRNEKKLKTLALEFEKEGLKVEKIQKSENARSYRLEVSEKRHFTPDTFFLRVVQLNKIAWKHHVKYAGEGFWIREPVAERDQ